MPEKKIQRRTVVSTLAKYLRQHLEKERKLNPVLSTHDLQNIAWEFDVDDEMEDAQIQVVAELKKGNTDER